MSRSLSLSLYLALARRQKSLQQPLNEAPRPDGLLVWAHAHSADQAQVFVEAAKTLEEQFAPFTLLLTASAAGILPRDDQIPKDRDIILRHLAGDDPRLVLHWKPDLVIWTVTASHPAITATLADKNIRQILVDARAEPPIRPLNQKILGLRRALLNCYSTVLAADEHASQKMSEFGLDANRIETNGMLRPSVEPPVCNEAEREYLAEELAARSVWLATGVTAEEIGILLDAHQIAIGASHRLLLIIVPANPNDGPDFVARFEDAGFSTNRRSAGEEPERDTQVYIADTEGELGLWYRLSPLCFLGGTFGKGKAESPFEVASLGSVVLFGNAQTTHTGEFRRLVNADAAVQVKSATELGEEIERLLAPDQAAVLSHRAWMEISEGAPAFDRLISCAETLLEEAERDASA